MIFCFQQLFLFGRPYGWVGDDFVLGFLDVRNLVIRCNDCVALDLMKA